MNTDIDVKDKEASAQTDTESAKPVSRNTQFLHALGAAMLPNIFLFINYNHNHLLVTIDFVHTLIWAAIFSVSSVLLFLFVLLIFKSSELGLITSLIFWIGFWFYGNLVSFIRGLWGAAPGIFILALFLVMLIALFGFFAAFKGRYFKIRQLFDVISIVICAFFIFNFFPGARDEIQFRQAVRERQALEDEPFYHIDFVIDDSLPKPDIYWFWLDGMVGLETMENFYDLPIDEVRQKLHSRGFLIYENAVTGAADTRTAVPVLFSPKFYDDFFAEMLEGTNKYLNIVTEATPKQRIYEILDQMTELGMDFFDITHSELIDALVESGYTTIYIGSPFQYFREWHFDRIYNTADEHPSFNPEDQGILHDIRFGAIGEILSMMTPISIVNRLFPYIPRYYFELPTFEELMPHYFSIYSQRLYRSLIDSRSIESPKFTLVLFDHAHPSGWRWHTHLMTDEMDYHDLHPYAYAYALDTIFYAIDFVLSANPNAIIILQSDHGIHDQAAKTAMLESGFTLEEQLQLFDSVFSAVFIPELYGGITEPLAPVNISRVLVNRFVGQNYELIVSDTYSRP